MDPHCVWVILLTIRHVANFYLRCADLKIKVGVMSDHKSMASHCLLNKKSKQ